MKRYNNRFEAINEFRKYKPTDEKIIDFWTEYDWEDWDMGDWVLIQYHKNCEELSRPIYGIFAGISVWDQALVIHLIEKPRAWKSNVEILTNPDLNIYMNLGGFDPEVEPFELWTGNIKVLGHWKVKPTIGQLKHSLKSLYYETTSNA
jgi:hypothetical protein